MNLVIFQQTNKKMEQQRQRMNLTVESYPDDEQQDHSGSSSIKALDSTRSQESVFVHVGQPFEEQQQQKQPLATTETTTTATKAADVTPHIVMLMSTFGRSQLSHQERAMMMFQNVRIPFETIDGSNASHKEERNALFELSGMRGVYPQFFLVRNDEIAVIGDYDSLESINEASSLPDNILRENQDILTWDRLMGRHTTKRHC